MLLISPRIAINKVLNSNTPARVASLGYSLGHAICNDTGLITSMNFQIAHRNIDIPWNNMLYKASITLAGGIPAHVHTGKEWFDFIF